MRTDEIFPERNNNLKTLPYFLILIKAKESTNRNKSTSMNGVQILI